jgi:hypothetical protein
MQQNFKDLFPDFPNHARVWMYQADRQLDATECSYLSDELNAFLKDWAAHGKGLQAIGTLVFDRIVILCVNESSIQASGCSIDSSVRFMKSIGKELNVDFFDRLHLNLIRDTKLERIHIGDLTKYPDALMIDPMVANLGQLRESGIPIVQDSILYKQLA